MCLAAVAGQWAGNVVAADRATAAPEGTNSKPKVSPVLRPSEPPDSGQITLPGPAPAVTAPAPKPLTSAPSAAKLAPLPAKAVVENAVMRRPLALPIAPPAPSKPSPLMEIGREVGAYCQKQIGHWKEGDARKLLGEPKRHRPAYDEKHAVNGTIYAFTDPTNKYKELELDFDQQSGSLRTVFVYPPRLSWQECHRLWNGPVAAADAAQGRKFYSYTNRRLDVLVDPAGNVISLGWY
jgi:hypothetical protein